MTKAKISRAGVVISIQEGGTALHGAVKYLLQPPSPYTTDVMQGRGRPGMTATYRNCIYLGHLLLLAILVSNVH